MADDFGFTGIFTKGWNQDLRSSHNRKALLQINIKGKLAWCSFCSACYREKRRILSRGGVLLKEALDIVEKGKDHEAEEQYHSNLLGKLTLAFSERTAQDGFTGKEKKVASI